MKNVRFIVAICAALMIAAPAMALEVEISGHYFVESYNNSNENLDKDDASNDFGSMELMVKPVFKINENITLTTQFTALEEHVWGDDANPKNTTFTWPLPNGTAGIDPTNNFDWKAAYMTIKSPIGGFIVGRYIDTPWGLGLGDSTASHGSNSQHKDRIMWVIPVGDFISGAVYQRNEENDKGTAVSDQDFTKAYVFSAYKQENWSAGLLFANYSHKNYLSSKNLAYAATTAGYASEGAPYAVAIGPGMTTELFTGPTSGTGSWAGDSNSYYDTRGELTLWVLDPYFKGQFGPLGIEAELLYGWGEVDQDGNGTDDIDAEGLGYFVDLSYTLGPVKLWGGTTYVQGDSDYLDDTASPMGYFEPSLDHERGFLLTSDTSKLESSLGGTVATSPWNGLGFSMGNESGGPGTVTGTAGYQSFYVGADWQIRENLKLGGFFVSMTADDAPYTNPLGLLSQTTMQPIPNVQWDDEVGQEYDVSLTWDIMNNLTFKAIYAYLDAGDFWKQGDPDKEIENNTTIYTQLIVEF
jgi:hypothetical protein